MFDPEALPVPDLGLCCKTCSYPLGGLGSHQCPECGREFALEDYIPDGHCPVLIANGKQVQATAAITSLLKQYQIPFVPQADTQRDAISHFMGPSRQAATLLAVPHDRYLEAIDLIRRQQLNEPMSDPPPPQPQATDWTCPHCREVNPPTFEICWNCRQVAK